jgi:hypothetical protein
MTKKKVETREGFVVLPEIPTLEWLRQYDSSVDFIGCEYSSRGTITINIHRQCKSKEFKDHMAHFFYEEVYDFEGTTLKWVVAKKQYRDSIGKLYFNEQADWPCWVRRF